MKYKKGSTFPYTERQLRLDNPNVSFPANPLTIADVRSNFGIDEVAELAQPTQQGYKVEAGVPAGDPLTETWTLTAKTFAELVPGDVVPTVPTPPAGKKPKYKADLFSTTEDPVWVDGSPYGQWQEVWAYEDLSDYKEARLDAYGSALEQIEYITENGLDAWQTNVATIKTNNPKS